ncbi:BCAM0308 family protein [Venenivibrio stagnispumantis]|uniref:NMD3 family protein n=1 Tax=Venenivibrio stagnispumantis TaxID=407998 RepID=A0AA45WMV2_9AQUI|nr:BCAM0308 family protein [Venenivibrio stagnispumantis]MCW4573766.1 BCAM0308 family protein [Venenivibrio stagnispumantis]SMP15014.1 NMD3 family protein [Venenivibrio stagnispumantis]
MEKRKDKLIQEYIHDPYFTKEKYHDPSVCERCGVVFHDGIFEWLEEVPKDAQKIICPACRRIEDNYEGGIVYIEGDFWKKHEEEIKNLIKNTEESEMAYRPLERIIDIKEEDGKMIIRTTYEHLARRIGEAIHKAYKGELKLSYPEGKKYVRVWWRREE